MVAPSSHLPAAPTRPATAGGDRPGTIAPAASAAAAPVLRRPHAPRQLVLDLRRR